MYISDVASQLWAQFWRLALFAVLLSVPLFILFILIIRSIVRPLRATIEALDDVVERISAMNVQIANATDEQSRVTFEVSESVTDISDLSVENETNNQSLIGLSDSLNSNSKELSRMVRRFRID